MLLLADYQTLRIKEQKNNRGVVLLTQEVFRVQAIGLLHSGNLSKQNGFVRVIKAEGRSFPAIAQSQHFRRRDEDLRCYDTDCVSLLKIIGRGKRAGRRKFIYKANAVSEDSEDSLSRRDRAMP